MQFGHGPCHDPSTAHCPPTGRLLDPALRLLCGGGSSSSKQVASSTLCLVTSPLLHGHISIPLQDMNQLTAA